MEQYKINYTNVPTQITKIGEKMTVSPFGYTFFCIIFPRNPNTLGKSMSKIICTQHIEEMLFENHD